MPQPQQWICMEKLLYPIVFHMHLRIHALPSVMDFNVEAFVTFIVFVDFVIMVIIFTVVTIVINLIVI